MQSPSTKPRRWLTRKEKGKMKAPEYGTETETSDQRESETATGKDVPPRVRSESAERATKSATQKLCRSTRRRTPLRNHPQKRIK